MAEALGLQKEQLFVQGHRACAGCGAAIALHLITDALGKDCIIVNATGCMEIVSSPFPQSSWAVPYIHVAFENTPAVASGIVHALHAKGNEHTKVVVIAGDGATYDIGFGALSGMLERNEDVLYICYDNEAYMNTGIQRSSATPFGASTTTSTVGKAIRGKQELKKPIVEICAAHKIPYAASTSIAFPFDVYNKIQKALSFKGSKFLVIHAPCVPGWGYDTSKTIQMAKMAVESGVWKMVEYEQGKWKITQKPKFTPVKDYLKAQKRFKHLTDPEFAIIEREIKEEYGQLEKMEKCL